jgi:cleavage and polyadenylation specificity factor subunit 1
LIEDQGISSSAALNQNARHINFTEIYMAGFGPFNDIFLMAIAESNDLVMYRVVAYYEENSTVYGPERLAMRLIKCPVDLILREPISFKATDATLEVRDESAEKVHYSRFIPFKCVQTHQNGVFIPGFFPLWIIVGNRRYPRIHRMAPDGEITGFTEFHSSNCQKGFLYYSSKGSLRICELPSGCKTLILDFDVPVSKIPFKKTTNFVTYHPSSETYVLVTSQTGKFEVDQEVEVPENAVTASEYPPLVDKYGIELVSPVTWEIVDHIDMLQNERVLCCKAVNLKSKTVSSGIKTFIAIGTGFVRGEDIGVRGRVRVRTFQ